MAKSQKDANMCIRHSYSDADEALRMIPSSATSFTIELDADDGDSVLSQPRSVESSSYFSVAAIGVDENSLSVDISNYKGFALQIVSTSLNAADATIQVQASIDDTNFDDIGSPVALASGTSTDIINTIDAYYKYFRIAYSHGTVTVGSITAEYILKG